MRLINKTSSKEVKRCFIASDLMTHPAKGKRYLKILSPMEFAKKFSSAKRRAVKMTIEQIDRHIAEGSTHRLNAYNGSDWYIGEAKVNEIGTWSRAGGLPHSWTNGSLKETADKVRRALDKNPRLITKRARRAIPGILKSGLDALRNEKYLIPIMFRGDTGTRGRRRLKRKMKTVIDDGNMRAIALAVHGVKTIRAYIGIPKKGSATH